MKDVRPNLTHEIQSDAADGNWTDCSAWDRFHEKTISAENFSDKFSSLNFGQKSTRKQQI
jgi:hypothetical protein